MPIVAILIVTAWHISYFAIEYRASLIFFIHDGFLKYDFIYTPLILPFFWWMGEKYDEAKFHSERDPLTSLYNRRFILKSLQKLIEKADKDRDKLSLFVVDINNLKTINDTYGHDTGDLVIRAVSDSLKQNTMKSALVARWGGDEFLVVMSETRYDSGKASLWEKINNSLKESSERFGFHISVSIGKSTYPESSTVTNELIRIADKNMYELKLIQQSV